MELAREVLNQSLHDGVDGFVVEGLRLVLQDEVDGVRLFACGQVLAFIDVKELDGAEQLLLCLVGDAFHFGERHLAVEQEGKVSADGWELAYLGIGDVLVLDDAQYLVPADVGEIDRGVDAECLRELSGDDTHLGEHLASAVLDAEAGTVDVVLAFAEDERAEGYAEAGEDVQHVGFEFEE